MLAVWRQVCSYEELAENNLSDCSAEDFEAVFEPADSNRSNGANGSRSNKLSSRCPAATPPHPPLSPSHFPRVPSHGLEQIANGVSQVAEGNERCETNGEAGAHRRQRDASRVMIYGKYERSSAMICLYGWVGWRGDHERAGKRKSRGSIYRFGSTRYHLW